MFHYQFAPREVAPCCYLPLFSLAARSLFGAYVVLHFWLARTLPWLQKGFPMKTAQFLLFTFGARPVVVKTSACFACSGGQGQCSSGGLQTELRISWCHLYGLSRARVACPGSLIIIQTGTGTLNHGNYTPCRGRDKTLTTMGKTSFVSLTALGSTLSLLP